MPFINSRLRELSIHLNYSGIKIILKTLIKKKLIFERSKLTKDQVLENENRVLIHDYICDHPGVYFNQIAKELGLSNYLLGWHIKMLLKFGFIRTKQIDNHEVFFNINLEEKNDEFYYCTSKEKSQGIINYMLDNVEGITKTHLSKELSMHLTTLSKYLKKLCKLNLIFRKKVKNRTIYFLNDEFYHEMFNKKKKS
ncbi:MAG: hypothetical protein EU539_08205 [Promethearchaeota archaeon]|nr:MAG: hypothetical protein EU539_08205 [Candidatus Lokiarchaeota archaeon]